MTSVLKLTGILKLPDLLREGYKVYVSREGLRLNIGWDGKLITIDRYNNSDSYRVIEWKGRAWYSRRQVCDHAFFVEEDVGEVVNTILRR